MAKRQMSVENIAAEVGRLFGNTEAHARKWLNQRQELVKALTTVQERAGSLIRELGANPLPWRKRGRKPKEGIPVVQPGMRESRKKRVMSEATRAKIRAAAKARWAKIKKGDKRKDQ